MPTPDAGPSATLEAIKERHRKHVSVNFPEPGICVSRCPGRWPCEAYRAASAAAAVLANHQPGPVVILGRLCRRHENHRHFSITRTEADDVRACPDCTASVYTSCTGCNPQVSVDTCPDRLAITRALNGDADE